MLQQLQDSTQFRKIGQQAHCSLSRCCLE
uniref:Uncharacterized protein n=1 Tax=Arundo donax TaxID=35708 RepID=A0A0A9F4P8_ARUDO